MRRTPRLLVLASLLVLLLAAACLPTSVHARPPGPKRQQQQQQRRQALANKKKQATQAQAQARYEPRHKALHRRYRKERQAQQHQEGGHGYFDLEGVVEERAVLSEPEPLTDDTPPPSPPPPEDEEGEEEDDEADETENEEEVPPGALVGSAGSDRAMKEEEEEKEEPKPKPNDDDASPGKPLPEPLPQDGEEEKEDRDLVDGEESSSSSSSNGSSSINNNSSFPAVAVPTPDYMLYNGKGPQVVGGEEAAAQMLALQEDIAAVGEEDKNERDLADGEEPLLPDSSNSSSSNSSFPAIAFPTPDYILHNGKGPLVVDGEGGREGEAVLLKLQEDIAAAADDDAEDDDEADPKTKSSNSTDAFSDTDLFPDGDKDVGWSYVSSLGSFFLIGASLLALAYHYSRRTGLPATVAAHNAQPQFNMSSPRITFASATHSPGGGRGGRRGGAGTPPQFHLEPTYMKGGRGRTGSSSSSSLPASSSGASGSPSFHHGRRGSSTNPLQLQHLNHHNLAQGPPSSSSSSSSSSEVAGGGGGGAAEVRGMSIYREAPCSACGLHPRTHALVPCSHLVCESCASTAAFCATCKSAVVSKNWVMSPSR